MKLPYFLNFDEIQWNQTSCKYCILDTFFCNKMVKMRIYIILHVFWKDPFCWSSWLRILNRLTLLGCCRISSGSLGVCFSLFSEGKGFQRFLHLFSFTPFFHISPHHRSWRKTIARGDASRILFHPPFFTRLFPFLAFTFSLFTQ